MTIEASTAMRTAALDAHLQERIAHGYRLETRSGVQAVIIRRHPLYFILRWFVRERAEQRLVLSVDEDGVIDSLSAQPLRW
jgi:hypothetical protein